MKLFNFSQNFFVKVFGIALIIYLALFNDKDNPNSLGYEFKKENLDRNISEAKEQANKIITNVLIAQELNKRRAPSLATKKSSAVIVIDEVEALSGRKISCNDKVLVDLEIKDYDGNMLLPKSQKSFVVGDKTMPILEKFAKGMRPSAVRLLNIPMGYKTGSKTINDLRQQGVKTIFYSFEVLTVQTTKNNNFNCNGK